MEKPNLSYINSMSRGDEVFVKKIIGVIKDEFPKEKVIYHENFNTQKFKIAAENVHKIKHKISLFGLEKSYSLATQHENNLKEGNADLHDVFDGIMQNITQYLEEF